MGTRYTRWAASALLIGLAAGGMTACSSEEEGGADTSSQSKGAMEDYAAGTTFKASEPLDFSLLYMDQPSYPYKDNWLLWEHIKETTNVSLDPTIVPMSDYSQKRSLLISSGEAPLILPKTYPGEETPFVSSGAVLPISDYVDQMPHYTEKVEKWGLEENLDSLRQEDGRYYVLPGLHEEVWQDYTLAVRTDIFEENSIAIPTTWDELLASLEELKEIYPDKYPYSERFEANSALNIAGVNYGTSAGWGYGNGLAYDQDADSFSYTATTDEYKELLEYFNSLVSSGVMDPESFTQSDEQAVQKFVSGESFVISANSQNIVSYRQSMDETLGKDNYAVSKINIPSGPAGNLIGGSRLENGLMLSAEAAERDDFTALLQFIDWLYYSDEGQEFSKWGVEGTTFEKDASGKRTLMPEINYNGLNPAGTKDLRTEYGFSGGVFAYGGTTELLQSMMSEEELEFQALMAEKDNVQTDPPVPFSDTDREQATLLSTPLKDAVDQETLKFILGSRPLSEFDDFTAELEAKGMDRYLDMANEAYQSYKETTK